MYELVVVNTVYDINRHFKLLLLLSKSIYFNSERNEKLYFKRNQRGNTRKLLMYLLKHFREREPLKFSAMKTGFIFVNYRHDDLTSRGFVKV